VVNFPGVLKPLKIDLTFLLLNEHLKSLECDYELGYLLV